MNWKKDVEIKLSGFAGKPVTIINFSSVGGGSINEAFKLETNEGDYFVKRNSALLYPNMFEAEAKGLQLLGEANEIDVPEVIGVGESIKDAFLILKFINSADKSVAFWDNFGIQLSNLHKHTTEYFGLNHDNYIGSLHQHNNKHDSWADFFREERLDRQVRLARNSGRIDRETVNVFERFYLRLDNIFPEEPPALLHGDLWSGNFMVNEKGDPVIIDPAVYYGHREMDLGMSQLFGGFDAQFYQSYNSYYPMEKGWEERLNYCNLYPLLVHVNLFGGGYLQSVKAIIQRF